MTKWTKVWIIIAVCFFIGGAAAFVIGMSSLGWDFMALDTLEYTEVSVSAEDIGIESGTDIECFEYDGYDWSVAVTKGETFSIKYYITENTKEHSVAYDEVSGKVTFKYDEEWYTNFSTGFKGLKKLYMKVEVTVPENIELIFKSVNLDININGMDTGNITLNGTNTDLTLSGMTAGDISVIGTNTDIDITSCTVGNITVNSTNCGINLTGTAGNALTATGTNMDLDIKGGSFISVYSKSTNNDVKIENCTVTSYTFEGTNTDVELRTAHGIDAFKSISFSGTNLNTRINGEKENAYSSESGTVTFKANGTNVKVRIFTAA